MPERERALRIGVDDQAFAALAMGGGGKMRGQRGLAGAALARSKRDDVHGWAPGSELGGRDRKPAAAMVNERLRGAATALQWGKGPLPRNYTAT